MSDVEVTADEPEVQVDVGVDVAVEILGQGTSNSVEVTPAEVVLLGTEQDGEQVVEVRAPDEFTVDIDTRSSRPAVYTSQDPTPEKVGGIEAGRTFASVRVEDVIDELLHPYQYPSFTQFAMSGQGTNIDVGTSLGSVRTFVWNTNNNDNIANGTIELDDGSTVLASGLDTSGSVEVNIDASAPQSPATRRWYIRALNTKSEAIARSYTIAWLWRRYFGTSENDVPTDAEVQSFSSQLGSSGNTTYALGAGGYKFIVLPTSWSAPSDFIDTSTNLSVSMTRAEDHPAYTGMANGKPFAPLTVTNPQGVATTFRMYRSRFLLGGSISIRVV